LPRQLERAFDNAGLANHKAGAGVPLRFASTIRAQ
jgi:hypothetical protein